MAKNQRRSTKGPANHGGAAQIRIVGGNWRGRKLPVLDQDGLRPTTGRLKETLFNWIQFDIAGKLVLDAFSGSGSLGFEALSRGAKFATMIELNGQACQQLKANQTLLGCAQQSQVINDSSINWLQNNKTEPFDLVFIDPPFSQDLYSELFEQLLKPGVLSDGAILYVESNKEIPVPESFKPHKFKKAGQVLCNLYKFQPI